ncbi:hypothetical protein P7K49_029530 [Saguinus oedipus]|uniref:Uncharacterized protein n=1 Tax=Saguinus oedipus TaxID=9490 RepID=A0ABQ9U7H6_SAGOE|nr:hypothetical protein P7K49_029530 [Saguinus oedipus]
MKPLSGQVLGLAHGWVNWVWQPGALYWENSESEFHWTRRSTVGLERSFNPTVGSQMLLQAGNKCSEHYKTLRTLEARRAAEGNWGPTEASKYALDCGKETPITINTQSQHQRQGASNGIATPHTIHTIRPQYCQTQLRGQGMCRALRDLSQLTFQALLPALPGCSDTAETKCCPYSVLWGCDLGQRTGEQPLQGAPLVPGLAFRIRRTGSTAPPSGSQACLQLQKGPEHAHSLLMSKPGVGVQCAHIPYVTQLSSLPQPSV